MKSSRLKGHALVHGGRKCLHGLWTCGFSGTVKCKCGAESLFSDSSDARKRWHRAHKGAVQQKIAEVGLSVLAGLDSATDAEQRAEGDISNAK
jgi:hypothetical protein